MYGSTSETTELSIIRCMTAIIQALVVNIAPDRWLQEKTRVQVVGLVMIRQNADFINKLL